MGNLLNLKSGSAMLSDLKDGLLALGIPIGANSNVVYLDPANGSDGNEGDSPDRAVASLTRAYALCTDNQNDTIVYIPGTSGYNLTAAFTWAKSYTHLVGLSAPTAVGNRARFFQLSTLTGASPLLTISGSGCIFSNFYIFQGVADATSLVNVSVTGSRNYFHKVHFAGGGHATQAVNGGASLLLNGGSENLFEECTIGADTIDAATGMMGLLLDAEAARNVFKNCKFTMSAGHTGAGFVEVVDATGIDRYTLFDNCLFINSNFKNFLMAGAFVIPAIAANRNCSILLKDCMLHGVSKLDADDRGFLYGNMSAITGADGSGVAVELIT